MNRKITTLLMVIVIVAAAAGCSTGGSREAAARWLGKDRTQLAKTMGEPKHAIPLEDTGGEILFYSYEGHHYVFETNSDGLIKSAVQTE